MEDLFSNEHRSVLILIVMDDPLRGEISSITMEDLLSVLILIVMDDPLRVTEFRLTEHKLLGLNPYCNG